MKKFLDKITKSIYNDVEYNKEYSKIYKIHKYWARKPWYIVEEFINKYSKPNDLVIDPFCGSGCTGVEAICNGRNFCGIDLNPIAIQVSEASLIHDLDKKKMEDDFKIIEKECKDKIMSLYKTSDKCSKCGNPLYVKFSGIGPKYEVPEIAEYCPLCSDKVQCRRKIKEEELEKTTELKIPFWYPTIEFPKKFYKDRFSYKGVSKVCDMYSNKNLYALSLLLDTIDKTELYNKTLMKIAFSNTVLHASKLKGENVRPLGVNNYWIPDDYIEENVWFRFEERVKNTIVSKTILDSRLKEKGIKVGKYSLINGSTLNMEYINEADYVFTDPPYGEAIQYSELSFIWNAWMNKKYENKEEIIINPVQNKKQKEFNELLFKSIDKIYDSLKKEKYFTLCFQNKDYSIWKEIINYCKSKGFVLNQIGIYDTFGSSFNKNWAKFSPKADIYITFKKTKKINKSNYFDENFDLKNIIKDIIDYYDKKKDSEFDNIRLYDITIAYIIWSIFYNTQEINIENFDTKKFSKLVDEVMEDKKAKNKKDNSSKFIQMSLFVNADD